MTACASGINSEGIKNGPDLRSVVIGVLAGSESTVPVIVRSVWSTLAAPETKLLESLIIQKTGIS